MVEVQLIVLTAFIGAGYRARTRPTLAREYASGIVCGFQSLGLATIESVASSSRQRSIVALSLGMYRQKDTFIIVHSLSGCAILVTSHSVIFTLSATTTHPEGR